MQQLKLILSSLESRRSLRQIAALLIATCTFVGDSARSMAQEAAEQRPHRFTFEQDTDSVTVRLNGQLFTKYHTAESHVPYLWPIVGPGGVEMTRAFPMREGADSEAVDHVHHRSMWFSHGDVNGIDFWHNSNKSGRIKHRRFIKVGDQEDPTIIVHSEWLDDTDEKLCSDVRVIRFGASEQSRWIDFDISILADGEEAVTFGDTKEGCLGLRVASTLKVDAELGGEIVNNNNERDAEAWGKTGAWVDYHGPIGNQRVGIAVLNHPDSFRFPTHWHVRSYGLFAANVFGLRVFRNAPNEDGSVILEPGDSITFGYRILLHEGDEDEGNVRETFIEYAKVDKSVTPAEIWEQVAEEPTLPPEPKIEIQPQTKTASVPKSSDS